MKNTSYRKDSRSYIGYTCNHLATFCKLKKKTKTHQNFKNGKPVIFWANISLRVLCILFISYTDESGKRVFSFGSLYKTTLHTQSTTIILHRSLLSETSELLYVSRTKIPNCRILVRYMTKWEVCFLSQLELLYIVTNEHFLF